MEVLKAIAAFLAAHMTKILGTASTFVAATLGAAAAKQIPDLVAIDSPAFQVLTLLNILLGGATIGVGFNNSARVKVATAIDNALKTPAPGQGGFARAWMLVTLAAAALLTACVMTGCASNPAGGQELSATGKVALQEVTAIAVRRAVTASPRAAEKAQHIRAIAVRLQSVTSVTTVSELKQLVSDEVDKLGLATVDRADAESLLNIFAALLTERLGTDELDAAALVKVNEFVSMIVAALPPV